MEWFSLLVKNLAKVLTDLGVPKAYGEIAALGLFYILATLVVVLLILVLWRLAKPSRKELPPEKPIPPPEEEKEVPSVVEKEEPVVAEKPLPAPEEPAEKAAEVAPPPEEAALPVEEERAEEIKEAIEEVKPPLSLLERMRIGLAKTQSALVGQIDGLLRGRPKVDEALLEDLEEILVTADFGIKTTQDLIQSLEKRLAKGEASTPEGLRSALAAEIRERLGEGAGIPGQPAEGPSVLMVVGVNGVGKTTTIGKLANQYTAQGKKVILGAGDTFRAAAAEQLAIWGERAGVEVIRHTEGADPAAVAFDAAKAAVARKADLLILDTAGRLHTKVNLMEELKKIRRVLAREIPGAPHETLLVLDATTGQNALVQARLFKEAVEVTGVALTKLDGTAKGGVIVAIGAELGLPVRYVGIGEKLDDLRPFDPDIFVQALFQ
jgi:fused signal recognition particle receptor